MTARTTDTGAADWSRESGRASDAVIRAIAEARGVDPLELEPIQEHIDLDAVDRLFASAGSDGRLIVDVAGCRVRLQSDGEVTATVLDSPERGGPE